jgi:hypothetical protein
MLETVHLFKMSVSQVQCSLTGSNQENANI